MESVIKVENVVTRFGTQEVHSGISFEIQAGSIVTLIGGSGTGKSVLLREIIGILRPTSGTTYLFGEDMWSASAENLQEVRKRFGVLFQNGALFSSLTAGENVAVPLKEQTDLPDDLIQDIVQLRLSLTGLAAGTCAKMPSELSGGMVKRVALARALALEPEILFLDEPTSGLDPINARAFDTLIKTLRDGLGLTVFMVTHDLNTLWNISDRVIALSGGKVLADGSAKEVSSVDHPWIREYFSSRT